MIKNVFKFLFISLLSLSPLSAGIEYDIIDLGFSDIERSCCSLGNFVQINQKGSVIGEWFSEIDNPYIGGFLVSDDSGVVTFKTFGRNLLPEAINGRDSVIGNSDFRGVTFFDDKPNVAWLWLPEKGFVNLNEDARFDNDFAEIYLWDINEAGVMVGYGYSVIHSWFLHPMPKSLFVFDLDNGLRIIDNPTSDLTTLIKINAKGQVMANRFEGNAFIYDPENGSSDLSLLNFRKSTALAINSQGEVVGFMSDTKDNPHAFFYSPTKGSQLIDPSAQRGKESLATALNDKGEVIGQNRSHAFFWSQKTGMIDLAAVSTKLKDKYSEPKAINNRSEVVGYYLNPKIEETTRSHQAFRWTPKTGVEDLIDLIPHDQGWLQLLDAFSINDKGEIVGIGVRRGGALHIFKLLPKKSS